MSSIVQAKAEAQKLIKRYNQLQAEARTADAEEAARKATEAEKLVSQISALQTAISKLQARDKEVKEKEAKDVVKRPAPITTPVSPTVPTVKRPTASAAVTDEAFEDLKRAEAEKSALELRINRIEAAQRRTREQIDQLARAKQELAKLKSQAEQNAKERRANDEKLQEELSRRIEQKEREQQRLKEELEAARQKAEKDAELLKAQRDAARALIEKQQQLEREKLLATRRSSGSGKGILIGLMLSVFSIVGLGAVIWFTPLLDSVGVIARLKMPLPTNNPTPARPVASQPKETTQAQPTVSEEAKPVATKLEPPRALEVYQDNLARGGLGPVMIKLSEGSFMMGAKGSSPYQDELPSHEVKLQSFSISRFEITFEDFDVFAESTNLALPKDNGWGRGKQPVINVTWEEAVDYTKWLSQQTGHQYRLPSEREWEYAAGGGKDTLYWWGNELGRNRANCAVCGSQWDNQQPSPVGSFQPNPLGLNDTIGNVLEWTVDCFRSNYINAPTTGNLWQGGSEDCSRRVARSGSFRSYENALRTTKRNNYSPRTRLDTVGFRVVRVD